MNYVYFDILPIRKFWETPSIHNMKNRFWAGLGSRPIHEKEIGVDYEQILRAFIYVFRGKKNFENITAPALKSFIEKKGFFKKFLFC